MNKLDLHQFLHDALDIIKNNNANDDTLSEQFDAADNDIKNFVAKVLIVGGFSAGKSAMLNTFLGNTEILPENISPETAIATEIIYGTDERVIRIKENGDTDISNFDYVRSLSSEGYSKYVYVLDRPQLRDLHDLVLVDMPGFDSGIEAHNRALMQYIGDAAAYVFVIDMNKGTIEQSSLEFLAEIQGYSDAVSFVLTKSDKVTPANAENIRSEMTSILENTWGGNPSLMVMSIHEECARSKLVHLFNGFSADRLLLQKNGERILFLLQQAVSRLEMQMEALEFNPKDIDLAIMRQENQKKALLNKIKHEENRLRDDMRMNVPNRILSDVEASLRNQIPVLVGSAMQGNEAFRAAINNILRPVLLQSTERHIEASFDDYMGAIANFSNEPSLDVAEVTDKLKKTIDSVKTIAEAGRMFAKAQKYGKMYKLFSTGLAVTTNIVAPWMELIIIFLPDILSAINSIMGQSREEQLRSHIEQIAIPQICDNLRPEIQNALLQLEEEQIETIKSNFQTTLDNEVQALEKLKEEKENRHIDIERKKESLHKGIREITAMIATVEENMSVGVTQ